MSVYGDKEVPFMKELMRVLLGICCDKSLFRRCRRLAIGILCPTEIRRDAVHIAQYIVKNEVAIGHCSIGPGEIDTVVRRGVDCDVLERDIAQRFIGGCPNEHRMTTGVVDSYIVKVNIVDRILCRTSDIECSLHRTPEVTFITTRSVDTAGMLDGNIIDVECTGLVESVSIKVGVDTQTRFERIDDV